MMLTTVSPARTCVFAVLLLITGCSPEQDRTDINATDSVTKMDVADLDTPGKSANSAHDVSVGLSADCANPSTAVDQRVCGDAELASLDRRLELVYRELQTDPESGSYFFEEHQKWLSHDRSACGDAACLRDLYTSRLDEMETARQYLNKPAEFR